MTGPGGSARRRPAAVTGHRADGRSCCRTCCALRAAAQRRGPLLMWASRLRVCVCAATHASVWPVWCILSCPRRNYEFGGSYMAAWPAASRNSEPFRGHVAASGVADDGCVCGGGRADHDTANISTPGLGGRQRADPGNAGTSRGSGHWHIPGGSCSREYWPGHGPLAKPCTGIGGAPHSACPRASRACVLEGPVYYKAWGDGGGARASPPPCTGTNARPRSWPSSHWGRTRSAASTASPKR